MKIKHLLLAVCMGFGALTASAQKSGAFRWGVTAGMNLTNITNLNGDSRIGFNAGVRGEYNFTSNIYANFGALISLKGNKYDFSEDGVEVTTKLNPYYLEIPLAGGYRFDLGNGVSIFGETGPYFAIGIAGKTKTTAEAMGQSKTEKTDFFGDGHAKRFDAGWGLRAGVEVSSFQIHLGYNHGFVNMYDTDGDKCTNSNFNVGVTYMF